MCASPRISFRPTSMISYPAVIRDCVSSSSGYAFISPFGADGGSETAEGRKSFTHASTDASRRFHPRSRRQRCRLCWGRRSARWCTETRSAGRKAPWSPWGCRCKRANACLKHEKSCEVFSDVENLRALCDFRQNISFFFAITQIYPFVSLRTSFLYKFYMTYILFYIYVFKLTMGCDINNRSISEYMTRQIFLIK